MLTSLQGKSVLVTGGTSGIGLGIAVGFARQGAKVAISGRQRDKVEAVASRLRDQGLAILFVTHFLDQTYALADRITADLEPRVKAGDSSAS